MSYTLDETDKHILRLLQENARYKNTEIAEKLDLSEGAIRKRINKLVENQIIEKFTIQINEEAYGMWAVVQIEIKGTAAPSDVREDIEKRVEKGLDMILETAGDIDLMCLFHTSSDIVLKNAIEKIRKIPGVRNTKTYVVLKRTKLPTEIF